MSKYKNSLEEASSRQDEMVETSEGTPWEDDQVIQ